MLSWAKGSVVLHEHLVVRGASADRLAVAREGMLRWVGFYVVTSMEHVCAMDIALELMRSVVEPLRCIPPVEEWQLQI